MYNQGILEVVWVNPGRELQSSSMECSDSLERIGRSS